jgi:hypothetical protein
MMRKRPANLPARPQPRIIVGFDSEWVADGQLNKMLSYQMVVLNADTGKMSESYFPLDGRTSRRPKDLGWLLAHALRRAITDRVITTYPDKLILAAHFARADLTALADFNEIKSRLTALRKTYSTTAIPLPVKIATQRGEKKINVSVVDTMLLAPAKTRLEKLGADLGVPKVELPVGYTKDRMDLFQADRPDEFRAYALTDALVAARWAARVLGVLGGLGITKPVATLAAAAVELAAREIAKHVDLNGYLGKDKSRRGKPRVKPNLVELWPFAAQTYHGGLNSVFSFGLSPEDRELTDVDIASAYTTSLAMAQIPDWPTARKTTNLDELAVVDEAMTFAYARFKFPTGTLRPCLPVRASKQRGLIYPLAGETWCCGPELVGALGLGAEIEVLGGWRVDWKAGGARPLEGFTQTINRLRTEANAAGDTVREKTLKEIGNSGYGKFAQAVASMRVIKDDIVYRKTFDTKWGGETDDLGPSRITQPMIAAFVTSVVRAVLSEAVSRLPRVTWLGTVTTDGMLFAGARSDLDESRPLATAFRAARARITPDNPAMWEIKHVIRRALVTKTRGTYTIASLDWHGTPVIARAGFRLSANHGDGLSPIHECAKWIEMFRARDYDTKVEQHTLVSLRQQHVNGRALQEVIRQTRWNADLDLKNKPVNIRDEDGLFAADTVPWANIDAFEDARDDLDAFRKTQSRVIKTARDYLDMLASAAGQSSRRAVNARASGKLPPLARAVALATMHGVCGVSRIAGAAGRRANAGPTYADLASALGRLTGIRITKTDIKHAKHRGVGPEKLAGSVAYLMAEDINFAVNLLTSDLSAVDCLSELCGGESAKLQLTDAWRLACNALGEEEAEPEAIGAALSDPSVSASAIRFISSAFPDDAEALAYSEKDTPEAKNEPPKANENKWRFLAFDPENPITELHGSIIKTPGQDLRHPGLISTTYQEGGGAKPPPKKELVPQAPINAKGQLRNQFSASVSFCPVPAAPEVGAPPVVEIADQFPKTEAPVSAACADLGLSPAGEREGEQFMATLVDLAGPAFRSPGSKRIVAGSFGLSVAQLRAEIAEAIAPRIKAAGASKSAARKQALEIAFDKPGPIVAALLTRRSSASVLAALMSAARAGGVVQ